MVVDQTKNFVREDVTSSVGGADSTIDVSDASAFPDPSNGNYNIVIWDSKDHRRPDLDPDVEVMRVTGRDTTNDTLSVTRGQENTAATSHPSTSEVHISSTSKIFTDIDDKITSNVTISGSNGLSGGSGQLGDTINISISGNLSLDSDLVAQDGETIWDEANTYIPTTRLQNDSMTIAGNNVSLGGSTAINHSNLSNIFSDDHHAKYTDSEAVSAVNNESSLSVDISGDADTVDGYEATDLSRPKNIASLSSSDTSTNINQTSWIKIPWDIQREIDTDYTHDPANSPTDITFDKAGTYKVYANISYDSSEYRQNVGVKFAINGTRRDAIGLSGYVRSASGHEEASNSLEEFITVNAGDTLTVQTYAYGNQGSAAYLRNGESVLNIEQVSETVAHSGDADTVDGNHASAFVLSGGDTMTGQLTLDAGAKFNTSTLNLNGNDIDNVSDIEMDGNIRGAGADINIEEVTTIIGPANGDTDLTLETQGSGSHTISMYDGANSQTILTAEEGGNVKTPNGQLSEQGNRVATRNWATNENIDATDLTTSAAENEVPIVTFNTDGDKGVAWGNPPHSSLLFISSDDHHTRYADSEAVNAVGGSTPWANSELSNSSLTIAGNSVSLGGSTGISHGDLSNAPSSAHHAKYTDENAQDATNALLVGGSNVSLTYDDANNDLTIDATDTNTNTQTAVSDDGTQIVSNSSDINFAGSDFDVLGPFSDSNVDVTLTNDSVTVAGNSVSLGSSTSISADDLSDVATSSESAGQLPIWNGTNGQYENSSITGGNALSITNADASITIDIDTDGIQTDELDLSISPTWTSTHRYHGSPAIEAQGNINLSNSKSIQDSGTDAIWFDGSQNVTLPHGGLTVSGGNLDVTGSNDLQIDSGQAIEDDSANDILAINSGNSQLRSPGGDFRFITNDGVGAYTQFDTSGTHRFVYDGVNSNNVAQYVTGNPGTVLLPNASLSVSGGGLTLSGGNLDMVSSNDITNAPLIEGQYSSAQRVQFGNQGSVVIRSDNSNSILFRDGSAADLAEVKTNGRLLIQDHLQMNANKSITSSSGTQWISFDQDINKFRAHDGTNLLVLADTNFVRPGAEFRLPNNIPLRIRDSNGGFEAIKYDPVSSSPGQLEMNKATLHTPAETRVLTYPDSTKSMSKDTWTVIPLDNNKIDRQGDVDNTNDKFSPSETGWYTVEMSCHITNNSANTAMMQIELKNASSGGQVMFAGWESGGWPTITKTGLVKLSSGDNYQVRVRNRSDSSTINNGVSNTRVSVQPAFDDGS